MLMTFENTYAAQDKELKGLRDSVVWLRSQGNETIHIKWKDWYAGDGTINYIYIQSPQGRLIEQIKINYGDKKGSRSIHLPEEAGDYRIEFPGYFYRTASVKVSQSTPMVLEPAKGHMSFHARSAPLYFSVPKHTQSFTLCGKFIKGVKNIQLYKPDKQLYDELILQQNTQTLHFDCLRLAHPESGSWQIRFADKGKVAFWLDGIGNYFALNKNDLFVPVLEPGKVNIRNENSRTYPMGKIGAQVVNLDADKRIFKAMQYMQLNSFNYYVAHGWREPFNPRFPTGGDNSDPLMLDPDGFNWDDERLQFYRQKLDAGISAIFDSHDSWLQEPLTPEQQMEYAEFVYAYINHANHLNSYGIQWYSLWDEPNRTHFTYEQYESLLTVVAQRLKAAYIPEKIRNTSLLAISSTGFENSVTGKERIGRNWARKIYQNHDPLVDGIAFDYWNIRDLIELWRYNDVVNQARKIMQENDSDGNADEAIVINQTSMSSGNSSSAYDVNSHFGALWLTGAVCNAFNSGYLDAFHYFPTVDDIHHMKGLIYSATLPTALPFGPEAQAYAIKPIGHSMAMINDTVLDRMISVNSDSLEVDALAMVANDNKSIAIIVVNKFPRQTEASIVLALPTEFLHMDYELTVKSFGPTHTIPETITVDKPFAIDQKLHLDYAMAGETVYAFNLRRVDKE